MGEKGHRGPGSGEVRSGQERPGAARPEHRWCSNSRKVSSHCLEARKPRSRCQQGRAVSKGSGGGRRPLSWLLVLLATLGVLRLVAASPSLCPRLPEALLCVAARAPLRRAQVLRLETTLPLSDLTSPWRHLQRPRFQTQSHAQVLGGRTWL